jgi:MFS family permease
MSMSELKIPWYRHFDRYHWFVLIVAGLGWLFDTMDQQLFVFARAPAMAELLSEGGRRLPPDVLNFWGGVATSIFLVGWAVGGLFFGVLGDRIGRARTMLLTILVYSIFTGLSAFSTAFWDFALYRFLTGLGVGGEFAVGVALVAEVIPAAARPYALGFLQSLSTVGNITAALVNIGLGFAEEANAIAHWNLFGFQITAWRAMFLLGTAPALLAIVIRRRLREPERWQNMVQSKDPSRHFGSYAELFGNPVWRHRAIVGMLLATSGVIGLWGVGFFVVDLGRSVFASNFRQMARERGEAEWDRDLCRLAIKDPERCGALIDEIAPADLLNSRAGQVDAELVWSEIRRLRGLSQAMSAASIVNALAADRPPEVVALVSSYLDGEPQARDPEELASRIVHRNRAISGRLSRWLGLVSIMQNIGGFFGMYLFGFVTQRIGRRPAFAISFFFAAASTAFVFASLSQLSDIFWMVPIMGYFQFSLFGGYAIYFPELFPTHLRSTGTSFCYNVGRILAAIGPFTMGLLASSVFAQTSEPLRYSGIAMCGVLLLGILVLPFAPETRNQPLPD